MFALLFLLPIYFRVVKQHTAIGTAVLLLPQTCTILPCAFVATGLTKHGFMPSSIVLLGWICTSGGMGLLALLGAEKAVFSDVLLNLLSGFGVGLLMTSLAIAAKDCANTGSRLKAQTLLVTLRYLGSAISLVVFATVFQQVLRHNLESTGFDGQASQITKYTTVLVSYVSKMPDSQQKSILIHATDASLRTIWVALAITCLVVSLLNGMPIVFGQRRQTSNKI
jgi:hypothetical protein